MNLLFFTTERMKIYFPFFVFELKWQVQGYVYL